MFKKFPIFLPGDNIGWITAGPTYEMPEGYTLVRCAAEIPVTERDTVAFDISTKDFRPFDDTKVLKNLNGIIDALIAGEPLYVGCMGGTGRTGTALAIIAAQHPALSGPEAIAYIRAIYRPHAVETEEQAEQVARLSNSYEQATDGLQGRLPELEGLLLGGLHMDDMPPRPAWWKRLLGLG